MTVRINKWNAEGITEAAMKKQEEQMTKAMIALQGDVKRRINIKRSDKDRGRRYFTKSGRMKVKIITGGSAGQGEPPRRVSGALFNSIFYKVVRRGREVIGVVGSNLPYARRLELGFVGWVRRSSSRVSKKIRSGAGYGYFVDQQPHPYIRPSLQEMWPRIKAILGVK